MGLTYRLSAFLTIFFSLIIFVLTALGMSGKLYLGNMALGAVVVLFFIVTMSFPRKRESRRLDSPVKPGNDSVLSNNRLIIFILSLILGFGIVKTAINLVNPPFGWDSLNYHFTFAVEWLKHGNLQNPITINDDLAPTYYPINGSLIYLWLILPFKNVFLADLGQLPFFLLSFICLCGICRRLDIGREYSFCAAGLFSLTPNYFKQLEIAYVDVMVCAWFLAGVYFWVCFNRERRLRDAVLFSLSLGMLIGTKTIALLYGGILFFIFLLSLLKTKSKIIPYFLLSVSLIVLAGGYGYFRNFVDTGNPLYPMKVELLGREIFKGVYDKSNYSVRLVSGDYSLVKLLFHEGMGAGAIVFIIPGFFYSLYAIIRRKTNFLVSIIFSLPLVLFLIWRYLIPLANLRYLYPAMAMAYIAPFYFLQAHPKLNKPARVLTVICALAAASELASHAELISSLILSVILFFTFRPLCRFVSAFRLKQWLIALTAGFFILYFLNLDYNANEFKRYPRMTEYSGLWPQAAQAWQWLDENTTGNNIAYVGRPVPFPLYGTRLKNDVFYVSVNKTDPAMIHYFPDSRYRWGSDFLELHKNLESEGNYRQHPDYKVWLDNLKRRKTDYLFIYSLHQTKETVFPIEEEWAKSDSENFTLSFSNNTIHIYRILK